NLRAGVAGDDRRGDAAACREGARDGHTPGGAGADEVVEDLVGDGLVEDALVPELEHVIIEGLEFDTAIRQHILDADHGEIGQPRLRADRRKLRAADIDLVLAAWTGVGEGLDLDSHKAIVYPTINSVGYDPLRDDHCDSASAGSRARPRNGE